MGVIDAEDAARLSSLLALLGDPVRVLLLPAYFAYTGLRTEVGLLAGLVGPVDAGHAGQEPDAHQSSIED
jgi:hypothetical protein